MFLKSWCGKCLKRNLKNPHLRIWLPSSVWIVLRMNCLQFSRFSATCQFKPTDEREPPGQQQQHNRPDEPWWLCVHASHPEAGGHGGTDNAHHTHQLYAQVRGLHTKALPHPRAALLTVPGRCSMQCGWCIATISAAPSIPLTVVAESVEHGFHVQEIVGVDSWSSQTNDV